MMPFVDIYNHDNNENVFWSYNQVTGATEIITKKTIFADAPICDSYGERSNAEMLEHYGFTMENNSARLKARVVLSLPDDDPIEIFYKRLKRIEWPNGNTVVKVTINPTQETFEFIQILRLARISVATEQLLDEHHVDFNEVISKQNERQALSYILTAIRRRLTQYPTVISEDIHMLEQNNLTPNIRNIVLARISEKQGLIDFCHLLNALLGIVRSDTLAQLNQAADNHLLREGRFVNYITSITNVYYSEDAIENVVPTTTD